MNQNLDFQSTPQSQHLFDDAQKIMPGGVNSPVRAFGSVGGTPRFMARAEGAYLWDADGNQLLDYVGSWGPMILGHAPHRVLERVRDQLSRGTSYGAPTALEVEMAQAVIDAVPSIEMIRMVNSGTEAVMGALRAARGFTGRRKIVKFAGCYHGHSDSLLVAAGSGAMTLGVPDSAGVTAHQTEDTLVAPFNDFEATLRVLDAAGDDLACVVVEPLPANMGLVFPKTGFLEMLREETAKRGAVLLFDEVMTGFRQSKGGFQNLCGVKPDMTTLGKIIGGGFPVGAYGGKREIMSCVAPIGPVYQAGTLSGNPIAMTAGLATLNELTDAAYAQLEARGAQLEDGLNRVLDATKTRAQLHRLGSMWTLFFSDEPVTDYESAKKSDTKKFAQFFHGMLNRGIYLPPSQFEAAFISLAHTPNDIEKTIDAAREVLGNSPVGG